MKYNSRSASVRAAVSLISLLIITGTLLPSTAKAGILGDILTSLKTGGAKEAEATAKTSNVQVMPLLRPAMNIDPTPARGGGDITIVDDSALMPAEGPSGTIADIEKPKNSTISKYIVREGDTLSGIAELFDVSANTIIWANNLNRGQALRVGQTLTILPVTGLKYTVKKGDTLSSIAKKHGADASEIADYNGIETGSPVTGLEIIIPDGEAAAPSTTKIVGKAKTSVSVSSNGYFIRPLNGGQKTQGIHGYNGIDIGAPVGTPILASATGDVLVAKDSGWNGGYGKYIVIEHGNGSQTLYAHASSVAVSPGSRVVQGQVIGYVGATGKSTGSHLHFEIRNGIRNPF